MATILQTIEDEFECVGVTAMYLGFWENIYDVLDEEGKPMKVEIKAEIRAIILFFKAYTYEYSMG